MERTTIIFYLRCNNGANVSNLSFVYTYWGSNFYENSYTPYFALGSSYYGVDYLGLRLELVFKKPIISNINAMVDEILIVLGLQV